MNAVTTYESITVAHFNAAQTGDSSALDALVRANLPLVKYIVRRFTGRGKEYDDLFQTGCLGLVKAIQRFDATIGVKFSTYAVPVIMGEIRRLLRDDNSIHISRSIYDLSAKIRQFIEIYQCEHDSQPDVKTIAKALSCDSALITLALDSNHPVRSLSERISTDSELRLEETIKGEDLSETEDRLTVCDMLKTLPENEKRLIQMRFFELRTQKEAGESMGLTQVQISRLEKRIITKLRTQYA